MKLDPIPSFLCRGFARTLRFSVSLAIATSMFAGGLLQSSSAQQKEERKAAEQQNAERGKDKNAADEARTAHGNRQKKPPRDSEREPAPQSAKRAYLGIAPGPVADEVREYLDLPVGFGVAVDHVVKDSPAAKAGLKEKDILMSFDGQRLTTPHHLQVLAATYAKGDKVELVVLRKGAEHKLQVVLGEAELPALSAVEIDLEDSIARGIGMLPAVQDSASPTVVQVVPEGGWQRLSAITELDQDAIREQVDEYRKKMSEWMKQPAAERGPAPMLKLDMPPGNAQTRHIEVRRLNADGHTQGNKGGKVEAEKNSGKNGQGADASADGGAKTGSGGASIRVGEGGGVHVSSGSSIVIGPGASIRSTGAHGGQVKIANEHGAVVIRQQDGKSVLEVLEPNGDVIYTGPWEPGEDAMEKLPPAAKAALKSVNLPDIQLLNIHVGDGGKAEKENRETEEKEEAEKAPAEKKPKASANYRGSASAKEKADSE